MTFATQLWKGTTTPPLQYVLTDFSDSGPLTCGGCPTVLLTTTLSNLSSNFYYDVYLYASCDDGDEGGDSDESTLEFDTF